MQSRTGACEGLSVGGGEEPVVESILSSVLVGSSCDAVWVDDAISMSAAPVVSGSGPG